MRSINREVHRRQLKVKVERKKEITQRAQRIRREGIEGTEKKEKSAGLKTSHYREVYDE